MVSSLSHMGPGCTRAFFGSDNTSQVVCNTSGTRCPLDCVLLPQRGSSHQYCACAIIFARNLLLGRGHTRVDARRGKFWASLDLESKANQSFRHVSRHLQPSPLSFLSAICIPAAPRLPSTWSLFRGGRRYITCLELPTISHPCHA